RSGRRVACRPRWRGLAPVRAAPPGKGERGGARAGRIVNLAILQSCKRHAPQTSKETAFTSTAGPRRREWGKGVEGEIVGGHEGALFQWPGGAPPVSQPGPLPPPRPRDTGPGRPGGK